MKSCTAKVGIRHVLIVRKVVRRGIGGEWLSKHRVADPKMDYGK